MQITRLPFTELSDLEDMYSFDIVVEEHEKSWINESGFTATLPENILVAEESMDAYPKTCKALSSIGPDTKETINEALRYLASNISNKVLYFKDTNKSIRLNLIKHTKFI